MSIHSIAVYCGSSPGSNPVFIDSAIELGRQFADKGIRLVYGGGSIGLMGAMADACLAQGGNVSGVITQALKDLEVCHGNLSELHVVDTMHERKQLMAVQADAFIVLPGGIGTLEEFFEVYTWLQLGIHPKPVAVLNIAGYYDHLIAFLENAVAKAFLRQEHLNDLIVCESIEPLMSRLTEFSPTKTTKIIRV